MRVVFLYLLFFIFRYLSAQVAYNSFVLPPNEAQPWTYWMWVNSNATKDGVQKDLEAMHDVGINGAIILDVDQYSPEGTTVFGHEKWITVYKHAVNTAERLGMQLGINNGPGYFGTGGSWIEPEYGLQWVVSSETYITGGKKYNIKLKSPGQGLDYKDIAVLAINRIDTTDAMRYTPENFVLKTRQNPGNAGIRRYSASDYTLKQIQHNRYPGYIGYKEVITSPLNIDIPDDKIIDMNDIIDLTGKMLNDGTLVWDVPEGEWTIIRFGHQWSGSCIGPVTDKVIGPEIDRMNSEALKIHFDSIVIPLKKWADSDAMSIIHTDSWEGSGLNWTPGFEVDFKKKRGYDIIKWLPVLTGRIVGSLSETERFMYDLRKTIGELYIERYMSKYRQMLHDEGLQFSGESYTAPVNDMDASDYVDIPMCEFWIPGMGPDFTPTIKIMSSVAQLNGLRIVPAEALTSNGKERWTYHPEIMKPLVDKAFCGGVNRLVFHRYTQQNRDYYPGPGEQMNIWGCKYERTNTWWKFSKAWHEYVTRCQYVFQNSITVADVLVLQPDESGYRFKGLNIRGYDYTLLGNAKLKDIYADNKGIYFPGRPPYKLLILPELHSMHWETLKIIKKLVDEGAAILGDKPQWVLGLKDYKEREKELSKIAEELWGKGLPVSHRKVGKGHVFSGITPEEALIRLDIEADFSSDNGLNYIHKSSNGQEIYFLANETDKGFEAKCKFRINNMNAQIWNPETGERMKLNVDVKDGCTNANITFEPRQSWFIVFDEKSDKNLEQYKKRVITDSVQVKGEWSVEFLDGLGAPKKINFSELKSWHNHGNPDIRYYSGTARYNKDFIGENSTITLDLGQVEVMAKVTVNEKYIGTLWKAPYKIEITDVIKEGKNLLEIEVVNLWPNRLIGDEQYPDDCGFDNIEIQNNYTAPNIKKWPEWLVKRQKRPTNRKVFVARKQWQKDDRLLDSGLLGPVNLYKLK